MVKNSKKTTQKSTFFEIFTKLMSTNDISLSENKKRSADRQDIAGIFETNPKTTIDGIPEMI